MKKILFSLFLFISLSSFGQIKISQLNEATTVNSTDLFLLSQGASSKKLTYSTLQTALYNIISQAIRMKYNSDSLRIDFSSDSTRFKTNNSLFIFNKYIKINADSVALMSWVRDYISTHVPASIDSVLMKSVYQSMQDTIRLHNQTKARDVYLSNGVKTGFIISINADPTKIDISAGTGNIIDNSNPANPVYTPVTYAGGTNISITNIATANATYIAINSSGAIIQQTSPFTPIQRRTLIILGAAIHSNRVIVNVVNNLPDVVLDGIDQFNDLLDALRGFNVSGNIISANGANLFINKSGGYIFKKGANFVTSNLNPHLLQLAGLTAPSNLRYRLQNGTEYANTNVIEPDSFDNAGVRTLVPSNDFTIQRIYLFPSNLIRIQFGQATYGSMAIAIQAIQTENFVTEQNIADNGLLRGLLVVKRGTTDLTDPTKAKFLEVDRFGGTQSVAGGSGTTTLQQAYDNSVQPQITTSALGQELQIKQGSGLDTDTVFSVLNGAGSTRASILGNGQIKSTKFYQNNDSVITVEHDPIVKAINGIVKSNGSTISAATNSDYVSPNDTTGGNGTGKIGTAYGLTQKQNILISGTNIKTINGSSLLGSGDIIISSNLLTKINMPVTHAIPFSNLNTQIYPYTVTSDITITPDTVSSISGSAVSIDLIGNNDTVFFDRSFINTSDTSVHSFKLQSNYYYTFLFGKLGNYTYAFNLIDSKILPNIPILNSATTNTTGDSIHLFFSKEMQSSPSATGLSTSPIRTISGLVRHSTNNSRYDLAVNTPFAYADDIKLNYSPGTIQSQSGYYLNGFTNFNVTNSVPQDYIIWGDLNLCTQSTDILTATNVNATANFDSNPLQSSTNWRVSMQLRATDCIQAFLGVDASTGSITYPAMDFGLYAYSAGGTFPLTFYRIIGGTPTSIGTSLNQNDYIAVRRTGSTIYYEYSTDGTNWTSVYNTSIGTGVFYIKGHIANNGSKIYGAKITAL